MKRRIALSIALSLILVLAAISSSDSFAQTQNQIRLIADTGVITLGPDQEVRVTMKSGGDHVTMENYFRRIEYAQDVCTGGVCKYITATQSVSGPISLMPAEAASFQTGPTTDGNAVRVVVLSNSPNVKANAAIVDAVTGAVISMISAPNQSSKLD